jgi:hypothetical protein
VCIQRSEHLATIPDGGPRRRRRCPNGGHGLFAAGGIAGEERCAAQCELLTEEGIAVGLAGLGGGAALLVEDAEPEVETPQQLDEPLVHERFRHEDQHALGAPDGELALDDEAGLDRLSEADFVGEKYAR